MTMLQNRPGFSMNWAPAPMRRAQTLAQAPRRLGQSDFIESPGLALTIDWITAGSASFLAWGLGARQNKWSTFWWVVAGITFVKGLHDMSRLGR